MAEVASAVVTVATVLIVVTAEIAVIVASVVKEEAAVASPEVAVAEVALALRLENQLLLSDFSSSEHRSHSLESILTRLSQL